MSEKRQKSEMQLQQMSNIKLYVIC